MSTWGKSDLVSLGDTDPGQNLGGATSCCTNRVEAGTSIWPGSECQEARPTISALPGLPIERCDRLTEPMRVSTARAVVPSRSRDLSTSAAVLTT